MAMYFTIIHVNGAQQSENSSAVLGSGDPRKSSSHYNLNAATVEKYSMNLIHDSHGGIPYIPLPLYGKSIYDKVCW